MWLDWKGLHNSELFPENQVIDSNKYCSHLDQLKGAVEEKHLELNRKGVIYHEDNNRPHISLVTRKKIVRSWEVLIHPPYSPDIAPSHYHLFESLQNSLNQKTFNSLDDCKIHLEQFLAEKAEQLWEDGIMKLPERWQKIVEQIDDCKIHLEQFLAEKAEQLWEDGIMKLPERWQKIVEQNGKYVQ